MPADKGAGRRALQPACDACHVRRVRCSHDQPCAHCTRLGLTCTYTKASTAKKTAGKRIEALRRAEQGNNVVSEYRDIKVRSTTAPGAGHPAWTGAYPPPSSDLDEGRGSEPQREHHFYTNHAGPAPADNYLPPNSTFSPSSTPWNPIPSPRNRGPLHTMEYERQVRFQHPPSSGSVGRTGSSPRAPYEASSLPPYSMQQQQQQQQQQQHPHHHHPHHQPQHQHLPTSEATTITEGGPHAGYHYAEEIHPHPFLPSPARYFAQPAGRSSSFGANSLNEGTMSTSTGTLDDSLPPHFGAYPLQTSILPPFSTSMADQLFNEQGVFDAQNFFSDALPPPLVATDGQQTMLDILGVCAPSGETPGSVDSSSYSALDTIPIVGRYDERANGKADLAAVSKDEAHPLSDSVLIPTLALFYEKLGGVMPVFSRNWLFSKLDKDDHHHEPQFAAMLLAMSALTIIQAQPASESKEKKVDRIAARKRRLRAVKLLDESLRTRESPFMGQQTSLEACFTSFFIFATLFGLGEHSAAWFRLRESITLGHLCRLHEPTSYEGLQKDEAERRLRAYWLLAITERAFAIQRGMPIILTGNPRAMTASLRARFGFKELSDFPDLQLKLFDVVDENFVDCWNRKCPGQGCRSFDRDRAITLWKSFTDSDIRAPSSQPSSAMEKSFNETDIVAPNTNSSEGSEQESGRNSRQRSQSQQLPTTPVQRGQIQRADVEVTRHWLLNRLWLITLSHGLLSIDAKEPPLRVDHAIHVAKSVLDICNYNLSLPSMEAHGVGFTYKLYDIAQTLVMLCKDETIAEAISKGGAGAQLKGQTTAAHTNGRGASTGVEDKPSMLEPGPSPLIVDTSGPANLRRTVSRILNEYLVLFRKFRQGDHPYLAKLEESISEVMLQVRSDSAAENSA